MVDSCIVGSDATAHSTISTEDAARWHKVAPFQGIRRGRLSRFPLSVVCISMMIAVVLCPRQLSLLAIPLLLFGICWGVLSNQPLVALEILVTGFAVQDLLMRFIGKTTAGQQTLYLLASSWKELGLGLLALALIPVAARRPSRGILSTDAAVGAYCCYSVMVLLLSTISTRSLYALRGIVEPFVFYLVARIMLGNHKTSARLVRTIMFVAIMVSLFGLIQANVLGIPFLELFPPRYQDVSGTGEPSALPTAHVKRIGGMLFLRASSTFPSPNEFGMYLAICALCGLGVVLSTERPRLRASAFGLLVVGGILLIGLLNSASRSSWLAVAVGIIVLLSAQHQVPRWAVHLGVVLALAAIVAGAALGLPSFVGRTLTGQEISAAGRIESLTSGWAVLRTHPFGVGLGMSGPRMAQFAKAALHTENYYLLLGFDMGILGLMFYIGLVAVSAAALCQCYNLSQCPYTRGLAAGSLASLIGVSIAVNVIPSLQNTTVASLLWLLVGSSMALYRREKSQAP